MFRRALVGLGALALTAIATPSFAHESVKPIFQKALANAPGKTFTTIQVDFPPGVEALPHRHGQAFLFAYVLEGTVISQLEGEEPKTYKKGEFWYEPPGAHHIQTVNASKSEPARLLVSFVADDGAALKVDDTAAHH